MSVIDEMRAKYNFGPADEEDERKELTAEAFMAKRPRTEQQQRREDNLRKIRARAEYSPLKRAGEEVVLGATDAIEEVLAPGQGNVLERAVGATADVVRGLGRGTGEVIGAVDRAAGEPIANTIEFLKSRPLGRALGVDPEFQSEWAQMRDNDPSIRYGLEDAREDIRETAGDRVGDFVDDATVTATAIVPYAPQLKMAMGSRRVESIPERRAAARRRRINERFEPDEIYGGRGDVDYRGVSGRTTFTPKPDSPQARMIDDINNVDSLDPLGNYGDNWNALDAAAERARLELEEKLRFADLMDTDDVKRQVRKARRKAESFTAMTQTGPANAANAVYSKFDELLRDATGGSPAVTPNQLLQIRRDLDAWINANRPKIFNPDVMTGETMAVRQVRQAINDALNNHVGGEEVAESLRLQSSLLTARDQIAPSANMEGRTRFRRALGRVQDEYGLVMPHTPAAVGANTQPVPAAIGTGLMAAQMGGRAIGRGVDYSTAYLTRALQGLYNTGRGAIPQIDLPDEEERGF